MIINELKNLKNENRFRSLKVLDETLINLSSNDYIGIGKDKELLREFYENYSYLPLTSSSSRLISGNYPLVDELEKRLKSIYGKSALFFNSGFDCNCCVIETFFDEKTLIISDKLNHASIYDGIIHSGAKLMRYKHLDYVHLENILIKNVGKYEKMVVISETIYSMDGDCVDLERVVELKKKYGFLLMIDEAHSFAVYSYGIAHQKNLVKDIDFLVIPLGKGGGSIGSYLICEQMYIDYIVNKGRKFIYTTALPPINVAWNLFILEKMNSMKEKLEKLNRLQVISHELIKKYGLQSFSTTHIISILIGENKRLDKIVSYLIDKGFFVYGVKEPTVPKKTSRIRIGLTPTITEEQIRVFFEELNYAINNIF